MNREEGALRERAAVLRQAFDQAFAAAPADANTLTKTFLAIGVGGDNYALSMSEISGVFADKKVVPLPSQSPDLLGIVSFRGALVPVYDLRALLGYPAGQSPRWLVLVAPDTPVGLAFDHLDGYLDISPDAIVPEAGTEPTARHFGETLSADGIIRPVVGVASILETLKQRMHYSLTHEEKRA